MFHRYWESVVDVPGPATEELGAAARPVEWTQADADHDGPS
jgi:hypothetical protein